MLSPADPSPPDPSRSQLSSPSPQSARSGRVCLVGAGPGSPDLITVRGLKSLQTADAVLYDALVAPELLQEARPDALLLSVGKRGYCIGSTRQETIHESLVRLARMGLHVCRLQCGDPCIFGRGGEEAQFLAEAGIPYQIIPGVTSALGAAAEAYIPLTHRAVGSTITLVTGHRDPESPECTLDWPTLAKLPTLAFYMGGRNLAGIAQRLIGSGMLPDTPIAVIESGTLPGQILHISDLVRLQFAPPSFSGKPTLLIVGQVVAYREKLLELHLTKSAWEGAFA